MDSIIESSQNVLKREEKYSYKSHDEAQRLTMKQGLGEEIKKQMSDALDPKISLKTQYGGARDQQSLSPTKNPNLTKTKTLEKTTNHEVPLEVDSLQVQESEDQLIGKLKFKKFQDNQIDQEDSNSNDLFEVE